MDTKIILSPTTLKIAHILDSHGLRAILVGGTLRDHLLSIHFPDEFNNIKSKDVDIEVHGDTNFDQLSDVLSNIGKISLVGKSFGVIKLSVGEEDFDLSLPRRENSTGDKHTDFSVSFDNVSEKDAFKRRDFTINSIGLDIVADEWVDHFNGLEDILSRTLRVTDSKTFMEDPLRVFRAVQFASRFNLSIEKETLSLLQLITTSGQLDSLPKERVGEEMKKLLLKSEKPSVGLNIMREIGIIKHFFSELHALIGVPQNPVWHPEGCVWVHTCMAVDAMSKLKTGKNERDFLFLVTLLVHDLGKAEFTKIGEDGNITSIGHEVGGIEPAKKFMKKFIGSKDFIREVLILVKEHLAPPLLFRANAGQKAIRRLAVRLHPFSIESLALISKADSLGRMTENAINGVSKSSDWILLEAEKLNIKDQAEKPIIQGRDLIQFGIAPGPKFKEILNHFFELQLNGEVTNENKNEVIQKNNEIIYV